MAPTETAGATAPATLVCAAPDCDNVFEAPATGAPKRYCGKVCANRVYQRDKRAAARTNRPTRLLTCAECGTDFEAVNGRRRFCSRDCTKRASNRKMIEERRERRAAEKAEREAQPKPEKTAPTPKPKTILSCPGCGILFEKTHPRQQYHSPDCQADTARRLRSERTKNADTTLHPMAARYAPSPNPAPPVACLTLFRALFRWGFSLSTKRQIAQRAADLTGTDRDTVERQLARIAPGEHDAPLYFSHETAEALLLASSGGTPWDCPAFPRTPQTARMQVDDHCFIRDEDLSEAERVQLAHELYQFSRGFLGLTSSTLDIDADERTPDAHAA